MQGKEISISVVMPVYNASSFLDESITSVLSQTFANFEFIIIDDGSIDDTYRIIRKYKDPRIIYYKKSHNYISTLNFGMLIARGKYIVRMDADDKMALNRLQVQFNYMEANPDIIVCGSWIESFGLEHQIYHFSEKHDELVAAMLMGNVLCHPAVIIRSAFLKDFFIDNHLMIYKSDFLYAEDYKLWCDIVMLGGKIANIQNVLLYYRCSHKQISAVHRIEMMKATLKIRLEYLNYIAHVIVKNYPCYYKQINSMINLYNKGEIDFNYLCMEIKYLYNLSFCVINF